jgi:hypothetical protein
MTKTNSDESLRALLRLLIDEIVDSLPRSGDGCESRPVQKPSPSMDDVVVLVSVHPIIQAQAQTTSHSENPLIGETHEEKETRQTSLGPRPGHNLDVTVNFPA